MTDCIYKTTAFELGYPNTSAELVVQESIIASIDRVRYSIPAPILYTDGRLEMKYDFPDSELSRQAE